jgi:hypothetical protein
MMLMIPNIKEDQWVPKAEPLARMKQFNEDLAKAGVLLELNGLHPSSKAARVSFSGGKPRVTDGPFTEAKEVIGGYWLIDVKSKEEAIEWARRVPADDGNVIEIRQIFEISEFPDDVKKAVDDIMAHATAGQSRS